MTSKEPKKTQGQIKMERYVNDLIRNKFFKKKIKRLAKSDRHTTKGMYAEWPKKEQERYDYINKELGEIIEEYEKLRKRCRKVMEDKRSKILTAISEEYNLDGYQIAYIEYLLNARLEYKKIADSMKLHTDLDLCQAYDFHDEELNPMNKGEEIIHLNRRRRLFLNAYPVAVCIHPKAAKRDVLDFIEKRWNWIENNFLRSYAEKKLKYGKRKHDQNILDFLWERRFLPPKKLKGELDQHFPSNKLAYFEISKILRLESDKRLGDSS